MEAPDSKSLPENAYETLKPGEVYRPIVPAGTKLPEATGVSIFLIKSISGEICRKPSGTAEPSTCSTRNSLGG